jgi:hypothetical protein
VSLDGPQGILPTWRARLAALLEAGTDRRTIERVIEAGNLDFEHKSVLWLWVWSRRPSR